VIRCNASSGLNTDNRRMKDRGIWAEGQEIRHDVDE
jgi:hypothetical protein